tara:strand:- start:659 stop:3070 length:2412 start_codon:yes stop_codon:yes gene_type:complete
MSGPFGSSQWMYSSASGFYPHTIGQSLRFEDGDSPYLNRNLGADGNKTTWTFSTWVKRGNLGSHILLASGNITSTIFYTRIGFTGTHRLGFYIYNDTNGGWLFTDRLFRDTSSWYHIVCVFDTSNSTSTDRMRIYVNGVRETSFVTVTFSETYPSLNGVSAINESSYNHRIGRTENGQSGANHLDGYLADTHFVDGLALTGDSFGETKDGIWIPKEYEGSYGTQGWHLDYADSSDIGNNANTTDGTNDWTPSGLAATDVVPDSPTNNFAVMNVLDKNSMTLSEGNLRPTPTGDYKGVRGNFAIPLTGKWFFEARVTTGGGGNITDQFIGIATDQNVLSGSSPYPQTATYGVLYKLAGTIGRLGSNAETGLASFAAGDVLGVAINSTDNEVQFYKNGSTVGSAVALPSTTRESFAFFAGATSRSSVFNFGQDSTFAGAVSAGSATDGVGTFQSLPTDFKALCSANLDEPAIIDGSQYFSNLLWTGDGSASHAISGVGFEPSLVWTKARNTGRHHWWFDSVRGPEKWLQSSNTDPEADVDAGLISFDSDGFTYKYHGTHLFNKSGDSYVSWNWKAGGSASSNSDGSITSSVSANPESGFSIVSFTHDGTNASTIGHGLGKKPTAIIMKQRSAVSNWRVFHSGLADGKNILLNSTNAVTQAGDIFQTAPTDTVFTSGNGDSGNGKTYIAYCFTDIDQYCMAGVYSGNGNADGTYVALNFRPSWVMIKRTDASADWWILDNKRNSSNVVDLRLRPNSSSAEEGPDATFDFVANGLKIRGNYSTLNASGGTYIYLAFAEQPFKYSNAR